MSPTTSRLLAVALSALACAAPGIVRAQPTQEEPAKPARHIVDSREFPESDGMIWVLQKRGETPAYVKGRLAEGRPGLDLVELAWGADRLDSGTRLLRAYVNARPDDDEHTLDLIRRYLGRFTTKNPVYKTKNLHLQYQQILRCVTIIRQREAQQP
ncbi:MAG TPA: hypothetical protein VKI43_01905, partial [Vicinamibacterales bacterium]|nr:hypothetical protein [Vicinamibacterales bacterium]